MTVAATIPFFIAMAVVLINRFVIAFFLVVFLFAALFVIAMAVRLFASAAHSLHPLFTWYSYKICRGECFGTVHVSIQWENEHPPYALR